ncbi:MAG TPA: hypothetical protein VFY54_12210 [Rubrobacter sp.]|nr:hypothetical protein [Rubrobacter sp.]
MTFVRFNTTDLLPAFIDPHTVRGIHPSRHGSDCALVVSDGGVKTQVIGLGPEAVMAALAPAGELGWRAAGLPASPTRQWCLDFAERLEGRLAVNRHKGDRPGWLSAPAAQLIARAKANMEALERAVSQGAPPEEVWRHAVDVANLSAMAADSYASEVASEAPVAVVGHDNLMKG